MRFQNVYKSNFDYEATYENLVSVLTGVDKTPKGLISFQLKPRNVEVTLSPKGKVQVKWDSNEEKQKLMPRLKSFLIPPKGQKLTLKSVEMHIYKVPYPGPKKFSLAWCRETITYVKNLGFWGFLKWHRSHGEQERDRKLRCIRARRYYLREKYDLMSKGEWNDTKDFALQKKWLEIFDVWQTNASN